MPAVLANGSRLISDKRPVRVNKRKYPPIENDCEILRRPNEKYVMNIPIADMSWVRGENQHHQIQQGPGAQLTGSRQGRNRILKYV
jgi:hypothetical protein